MSFPPWLVLVLRANDIPKTTELVLLGISNTGNTLHNELFVSPLRLKAFQRLIAKCWRGELAAGYGGGEWGGLKTACPSMAADLQFCREQAQ